MRCWLRRTLAPLVAGATAAAVLVTVTGDSVLPLDARSTAAQGDDVPDPGAETLSEIVAQPSTFDFERVFVDLDDVGEFIGLYEFGDPQVVDVAAELAGFVPSQAPGVAERFLLGRRCNAAMALATRRQVVRPVVATILRPDEQMIARIDAFFGGGSLPAGLTPLSLEEAASVIGSDLQPHAPPLVNRIEVGQVVLSELDFDLLSARDPETLRELVEGTAAAASLPSDLASAVATDPLGVYRAMWEDCLHRVAEEGTVPADTTLRGLPLKTLKLDTPREFDPNRVESGTDVVTWLESDPFLDLRVVSSFDDVEDAFEPHPDVSIVDPVFAEFDTDTWLQLFATPVEITLEIAGPIIGRTLDPIELLFEEAFAPTAGFEYGFIDTTAPTAALAELRQAERTLDPAELQAWTGDDRGLTGRVREVRSRLVYETGEVLEDARALFSEPPSPDRPMISAGMTAVVWDPGFLNSDRFRRAWVAGIIEATDPDDTVFVYGSDFLDAGDLLVALRTEREGVVRIHLVAPCYTVTISNLDDFRSGLERFAGRLPAAQSELRQQVFGTLPSPFAGAGFDLHDAPLDYPLRDPLYRQAQAEAAAEPEREFPSTTVSGSISADDLLAVVYNATTPEERFEEDQVRAARCVETNLQAFGDGTPAIDLDHNRIDDRLDENAVTTDDIIPTPADE